MDANLIIRAARIFASTRRAYFSQALFALTFVPTEGLNTIGVDKYWRCYYDPKKVMGWGVPVTAATLLHEIGHLLMGHAQRSEALGIGPENHKAANCCQDAELNDDLIRDIEAQRDGLEMWTDVPPVVPAMFQQPEGRIWEEYYAALPKLKIQFQGQGQKGKGGEGDEDAQGGSSAAGEGPGRVVEVRDCGSGATGGSRPHEAPAGGREGGKKGDAPVPAGVSPAEAEILRGAVAKAIQEHVKNRGTVPGGWQRWAQARLTPAKVDWRRELAAQVRSCLRYVAGLVDYSYARPGRRQAASPDIVLPSMRRPVPVVSIVIDTSGSMDDAALDDARSEAEGVCRALGVSVHVMSVDAAVHTDQTVMNARQIKLGGGGGTDMRVGVEHALAHKPKPDVIIVLTDGLTPWPEASAVPRHVKLIAVLVGHGCAGVDSVPHHIRAIVADDAGRKERAA